MCVCACMCVLCIRFILGRFPIPDIVNSILLLTLTIRRNHREIEHSRKNMWQMPTFRNLYIHDFRTCDHPIFNLFSSRDINSHLSILRHSKSKFCLRLILAYKLRGLDKCNGWKRSSLTLHNLKYSWFKNWGKKNTGYILSDEHKTLPKKHIYFLQFIYFFQKTRGGSNECPRMACAHVRAWNPGIKWNYTNDKICATRGEVRKMCEKWGAISFWNWIEFHFFIGLK